MTDPSRPPRTFTVTLPPRLPWLVGGGFAAGLLLFLLLWAGTRDREFFRGEAGTTPAGAPVDLAPLPAPLAHNSSVGMPAPAEDGGSTPPPVAPPPAAQQAAPAPSAPAPAPAEEAASIRVLESPPQRIPELSPAPEYPASALRAGESGSVLLDVSVDAQGRVTSVRIARRSGSRALDRAAVRAVEQWRFTPATVNGEAVAGQVQVPIDFMP